MYRSVGLVTQYCLIDDCVIVSNILNDRETREYYFDYDFIHCTLECIGHIFVEILFFVIGIS